MRPPCSSSLTRVAVDGGASCRPEGNVLYASGVDSKLIELRRMPGATEGEPERWVLSGRSRDHTHDVRAIAVGADGVLVTGGADTNLVVYPQNSLGRRGAGHRKIPPFPQRPTAALAADARLLAHQTPQKLQLWRLGTPGWAGTDAGLPSGHQLGVAAPPKLLVELTPRSPHHIACSAISPDGSRLAYSTAGGVRVFDVVLQEEGGGVRRLSKLPAELAAAQALLFSSDAARLVCLSADGQVQIVDLLDRELLATLTLPALEVPEPRTVPLLAASSDFQWVAVTHDLDVHVFNMDSLRLHCTLPRQPTQHTAMAFVPNSCHLVTALTSREVHIFDVEGGEPTAWSAKNSRSLPAAWLERRDKLVSISFNPSQPSALYLWDAASFGVLFTDRSVKEEEEGVQLEMVKRYQPLICSLRSS